MTTRGRGWSNHWLLPKPDHEATGPLVQTVLERANFALCPEDVQAQLVQNVTTCRIIITPRLACLFPGPTRHLRTLGGGGPGRFAHACGRLALATDWECPLLRVTILLLVRELFATNTRQHQKNNSKPHSSVTETIFRPAQTPPLNASRRNKGDIAVQPLVTAMLQEKEIA